VIRVERGEEVRPGIWAWRVPAFALEGRSRQPLLDACRAIQRTGGVSAEERVAKYREGHDEPDMVCPLDVGAATTVSEPDRGVIHFAPFRTFEAAIREQSGFPRASVVEVLPAVFAEAAE
jgi:hypothetical protein